MLKKLAVGLGCLGLLLGATTMSYAGPFGGGCICCDDLCKVNKPTEINVGYDLNIDIDVCVDAGNLGGDFWSAHAVIYQSGKDNKAKIEQGKTSEIAGIIQEGDNNRALIEQSGSYEYALILQTPHASKNKASITQSLDGATAIIVQAGMGNTATINQY
jgi:minor curlin subunit